MSLGDSDLIFLAGILDYAGAILLIQADNGKPAFPAIRLTSREQKKIELVADLMGIKATEKKGTHFVGVTHKPAQQVIGKLLPYLRRTKPIAERAMRWVPMKSGPKQLEKIKPKPAPVNVLVTPPTRLHERTMTGDGEIIKTPTGRIHRILG